MKSVRPLPFTKLFHKKSFFFTNEGFPKHPIVRLEKQTVGFENLSDSWAWCQTVRGPAVRFLKVPNFPGLDCPGPNLPRAANDVFADGSCDKYYAKKPCVGAR